MATLKSVIRSLKAQLKSVVRTAEKLEHDRERIQAGIAALEQRRSGRPVGRPKGPGKRRKMSAAGRKRIAAAQRARWAKLKAKTRAKAKKPETKQAAAS
jgi:hypothetical protein